MIEMMSTIDFSYWGANLEESLQRFCGIFVLCLHGV